MSEHEKTKELILQYKNLLKTDEEAAKTFKENHKDNELFYSLCKMQEALLGVVMNNYENLMAARAESDPTIRRAMLDSVGETIIEDTMKNLSEEDFQKTKGLNKED